MLEAEIEGLTYHRRLAKEVGKEFTASLKSDYDYSFIISYGAFDDENYQLQRKNALLIDLSPDMQYILSKFSPVNRTQVRRFDKMNALSFHQHSESFEKLYDFYVACEQDRQWYPVPKSELKNSLVFYVSYEGQPISGMSTYSDAEFMRVGRIFSLRRSFQVEQANLIFGIAAKRLVYEFCQYAKQHGYKYLDLGGVDTHSKEKLGLTEFKLSFGGQLVPVIIGRHEKPSFTAKKAFLLSAGIDIT